MARIKGGLGAKKRHNRVLKLAKGYRGARSKQYRVAKQSVMRALTSSYAGRKQRKRQFRQLWIARINAAARMNGLSYSSQRCGWLRNSGRAGKGQAGVSRNIIVRERAIETEQKASLLNGFFVDKKEAGIPLKTNKQPNGKNRFL